MTHLHSCLARAYGSTVIGAVQKIDLNDKAPGAINHDFQDQASHLFSTNIFVLHYFAALAGDLLNKLDSLSHSEKEVRWGEGGKEPLHIITLKKSIILLSPRSSQQFGGGVTDFSAITPVPASQSISKRQEVWVRGRWMDHCDRRRRRSQTPSPTSPTPAHASRFKVHRLHSLTHSRKFSLSLFAAAGGSHAWA